MVNMKLAIFVKSSSREEPYQITVSSTIEEGLSIFCDCPAGVLGMHCKHKMAVVLGDQKILYDNEQLDDFHEISKWIANSNYSKFVLELQESEKELEALKKRIKNMKEKIARLMREGLKNG